ncbi:MAG: hypothetical protein RL385_3390 [Pseudomonadota bacterium]
MHISLFRVRPLRVAAGALLALAAACQTEAPATDVATDSSTPAYAPSDAGASGPVGSDIGSYPVGSPGLDAGVRADAQVSAPVVSASETDLPCNVATLAAESCWLCHGKQLNYAAPMPLVTTADFKAMGKITKDKTVGALSVARASNAANPMPPKYHPAQLDDAEKKLLADWVSAGMPAREATAAACTLPTITQPGEHAATPEGGPEDCEDYYELRAHGQPMPGDKTPYKVPADPGNDGNSYYCYYFDAPYDLEDQGLWFAPIVDNSKVLHHWRLYGADEETAMSGAPGTFGPCSAAEPGRYLIAGWAPGAPPTSLPKDVGLHLSKRLVLEVHYYNNTGAEALDRSGVKFCTTKNKKRPHTAGVHFTGGEGICVRPGQGAEVKGTCDPADNVGDIHIINVWPHMHTIAKRMRVVINRSNGTQEVIHDESFDFNNQYAYPKDDIVLHPGDTMDTSCYYQNSTQQDVHFGERTQDEMCYGFITAWPRGALVTDAAHLLINPVNYVALPIQPALRCLDPTGIFNSCNGVADYPF